MTRIRTCESLQKCALNAPGLTTPQHTFFLIVPQPVGQMRSAGFEPASLDLRHQPLKLADSTNLSHDLFNFEVSGMNSQTLQRHRKELNLQLVIERTFSGGVNAPTVHCGKRTQQESNLLITTLRVVGSPFSLVSKESEAGIEPAASEFPGHFISLQAPRICQQILHRPTPPSGFEPKKLFPTTEIAALRLTVEAMMAKSIQNVLTTLREAYLSVNTMIEQLLGCLHLLP